MHPPTRSVKRHPGAQLQAAWIFMLVDAGFLVLYASFWTLKHLAATFTVQLRADPRAADTRWYDRLAC